MQIVDVDKFSVDLRALGKINQIEEGDASVDNEDSSIGRTSGVQWSGRKAIAL
jgi:hypothetical protein